jgi:phospholipase/carboxylesterase
MLDTAPLPFVVKMPRVTTVNPPLLLMLHGYGSHEEDLFSFADELTNRFLVVSARAPIALPWGGYAWYNINFTESAERFGNPAEAMQALEKVKTLVDYVHQTYGTNPSQTAIMGFSQGAILSYALAFHYPKIASHVLSLSGYIFHDILPTNPKLDELKNVHFFGTHGTFDPVIPIEWARAAHTFLVEKNLNIKFKEYPMEHGINPACFQDMLQWVASHYPTL